MIPPSQCSNIPLEIFEEVNKVTEGYGLLIAKIYKTLLSQYADQPTPSGWLPYVTSSGWPPPDRVAKGTGLNGKNSRKRITSGCVVELLLLLNLLFSKAA